MARITLDAQLRAIRTKMIHLGSLVEAALEQALQAVQNGDQALCGLVIAKDSTIDEIRSEIERLAFQSLTLQQPLAGADLRFLSCVPATVGALERIGDNAAGIAKLLLRMAPLHMDEARQVPIDPTSTVFGGRTRSSDHQITEASVVSGLIALGQEALRVLRGTMRAFEQNDTRVARAIGLSVFFRRKE